MGGTETVHPCCPSTELTLKEATVAAWQPGGRLAESHPQASFGCGANSRWRRQGSNPVATSCREARTADSTQGSAGARNGDKQDDNQSDGDGAGGSK
jgi:hypothetical protein